MNAEILGSLVEKRRSMHKVFSSGINSHRRNNSIEMLHYEGHVIVDHFDIKNHVVYHYETLLYVQHLWRPKLDGLVFETIDNTSSNLLEKLFEEGAVNHVVRGMARDKAPELDGFSMTLFQDCCHAVKREIMSFSRILFL